MKWRVLCDVDVIGMKYTHLTYLWSAETSTAEGFFQVAGTKSGCNLQNMLVSDSVQPWICTFPCSNFFYVPWNLIWNHVITPMYSKKKTLSPVSPKKPNNQRPLYWADMLVTEHNTDVLYSIVSTISPAYIAYVCVIWCQKQMFICDCLLLHRKIMWSLIVTDKPMSSSLQLNAGQFLLSWDNLCISL